MQPFVLCTDTGADIPWRTARQQRIDIAHFQYTLDSTAFRYHPGSEADLAAFYSAMREGASARVLPVTEEAFCALFTPMLANDEDVLYIGLSSKMSVVFEAAKAARAKMLAQYKGRRIVLIDTYACAVAQGMLAYEAAEMKREGAGLFDIAEWVVENRAYVHGLLMPSSTRWLGDAGLNIPRAPMLRKKAAVFYLSSDGGIREEARYITTEEAMDSMAAAVNERGYALKNQVISITHADAPALAEQLRARIMAQTDCTQSIILPMGPAIGRYAGPGAVGVAFFGGRR